jgi:hypothetical protein
MSQNKMVTKSDLSDFYQAILPYLGGQVQANWTQSDNTQIDYIKNKPEMDEWTASQTCAEGATSKTFTGLNSLYAYEPYIQCADGYAPPNLVSIVFNTDQSGTSCTVTFTAVTSAQAGSGGNSCSIKLRVIK